MSLTKDDLDSFYQYASKTLSVDDADSLEELVVKWRAERSCGRRYEEDVKAIAAAIRDMESGEVGRTAEASVNELRADLKSFQWP